MRPVRQQPRPVITHSNPPISPRGQRLYSFQEVRTWCSEMLENRLKYLNLQISENNETIRELKERLLKNERELDRKQRLLKEVIGNRPGAIVPVAGRNVQYDLSIPTSHIEQKLSNITALAQQLQQLHLPASQNSVTQYQTHFDRLLSTNLSSLKAYIKQKCQSLKQHNNQYWLKIRKWAIMFEQRLKQCDGAVEVLFNETEKINVGREMLGVYRIRKVNERMKEVEEAVTDLEEGWRMATEAQEALREVLWEEDDRDWVEGQGVDGHGEFREADFEEVVGGGQGQGFDVMASPRGTSKPATEIYYQKYENKLPTQSVVTTQSFQISKPSVQAVSPRGVKSIADSNEFKVRGKLEDSHTLVKSGRPQPRFNPPSPSTRQQMIQTKHIPGRKSNPYSAISQQFTESPQQSAIKRIESIEQPKIQISVSTPKEASNKPKSTFSKPITTSIYFGMQTGSSNQMQVSYAIGESRGQTSKEKATEFSSSGLGGILSSSYIKSKQKPNQIEPPQQPLSPVMPDTITSSSPLNKDFQMQRGILYSSRQQNHLEAPNPRKDSFCSMQQPKNQPSLTSKSMCLSLEQIRKRVNELITIDHLQAPVLCYLDEYKFLKSSKDTYMFDSKGEMIRMPDNIFRELCQERLLEVIQRQQTH